MSQLYEEQWFVHSRTRNKCLTCKQKFPNSYDVCPKCGSSNVEPLTHTVSLRTDGVWECGCESWIFGRKKHPPGWGCIHIEDTRATYNPRAIAQARQEGRRTVIQTDEYDIELEETGRLRGLINGL